MTSNLVKVKPPKLLYLRAISPDLPVQRTAHRDSVEGEACIAAYKTDVNRRSPPTCLPRHRIDDRTLGVIPASTTWTTTAGKTCVTRV